MLTGLTIGTLQYALMGNITGNGPVNASDRQNGVTYMDGKLSRLRLVMPGFHMSVPLTILTVIGDMAMYSCGFQFW